MQLVGDGVEMLRPDGKPNKRIGPDEVVEKFGVGPDRVIDVQSLAGDSVDNVPGAPGIGIKTAALLIKEYGDLETLLERAGEIKQEKRREALIAHRRPDPAVETPRDAGLRSCRWTSDAGRAWRCGSPTRRRCWGS